MAIFIVEGGAGAAGGGVVRRVDSFEADAGAGGFEVVEGASESAVRASYASGAAPVIWAAVNLSPSVPGEGRSLYVVDERFEPPIDLSKAAPENPELAPCLQRNDVDWVTSFIAADGSRCHCIYDAADAEAVRASYRAAKMPFVKVWRARRAT
jgi:hypothetical protein